MSARSARPIADGRRGVVLVGVLMLVLGVTLLAHAVLVLTHQELRASRAGAVTLAARLAARSAYEAAFRSGSGPPDSLARWAVAVHPLTADTLTLGGGPPVTLGRAVAWTRLSRETWLLAGRATGGVASRSLARPVWSLDPVARVLQSEAVVTLGDSAVVREALTVDRTRVGRAPSEPPAWDCAPVLAALDSAAWPGLPEVAHRPAAAVAALGRLPLTDLLARADSVPTAEGTPAPSESAGLCTSDPWNWGDPGGRGPCGARTPLVRLPDGASVVGGRGQGVLLVDGSAELIDTRFFGVVLAGGSLVLRGSASVTGLVRAVAGASTEDGSVISGSACWAAGALSRGPLRRPLEVPESGWIGSR